MLRESHTVRLTAPSFELAIDLLEATQDGRVEQPFVDGVFGEYNEARLEYVSPALFMRLSHPDPDDNENEQEYRAKSTEFSTFCCPEGALRCACDERDECAVPYK